VSVPSEVNSRFPRKQHLHAPHKSEVGCQGWVNPKAWEDGGVETTAPVLISECVEAETWTSLGNATRSLTLNAAEGAE
jgi:hypothetical protein